MSKKTPGKPDSSGQDRAREAGDLIVDALREMYVVNPEAYRVMASKEGVAVESIAAAAIAQVLSDGGHLSTEPAWTPETN